LPILGIWDGHDAGAAVVDESEGRIVCAANEERFTRRKLEVGFPRGAIEACLSEAGLEAKDVSEVAVSSSWRS
jgi:carbamoyltransferase